MRDQQAIRQAWNDFTSRGACESGALAPPIWRSWQTCRARNLPPYGWSPVTHGISQRDMTQASLLPVLEDLYEHLERTSTAIALFSAEHVLSELVGDADVLESLREIGLSHGSIWREEIIGTNALALALAEGHPCATVGPEHYCAALHRLAIAAAPLFGPDGRLLGAVAIITYVSLYQQAMLALVGAASQGMQSRLQMEALIAEANHHLTELNAAIETMSEGLLLISVDDRIARLNQRVEQILGISARAAAGRPLRDVLALPDQLRRALEQRVTLAEQEVLFTTPHGTVAVVCALRPITRQGHYLGALLTLQPPERLRSLVQQVVGAQAQMTFRDTIGESPGIQLALSQARIAANGVASVLLVGEYGTGKELIAHAIHQASARANGPFVTIDCATIPRTLIGIELFGYESRSDDPQRGRPGKLELAHGGTLLLKAIDALPMEQQTALLRAIESRSTIRHGGQRVVPIDVRIIATTVSGLGVNEGRFRPDLAARLSTITIELPPLRTRGNDILLFIDQLMSTLNQQLGKQLVLSPEALDLMRAYPWPGNVRELETVLEQVAHTIEHSIVQPDDLPAPIRTWAAGITNSGNQLQRHYNHVEREAILRAGRAAGGHLTRTAQQLGISRTTLWRKMQEHGLTRADLWQPH